jgi:CRISPR system Cascade subunit CasE
MYFSKIELRHETQVTPHLVRPFVLDGYRLHQVLWQLFTGNGSPHRDFLYRRIESSSWPCFYLVSGSQPVDEQGVWSIHSKEYMPKLVVGQRLGFSLRANPVVTKPGPRGKPVRHDVIMNAKRQSKTEPGPTSNQRMLIQEAGQAWLEARDVKYGFHVDHVRVDAYRQHQFQKTRGAQMIRFSTVDFNGILTVREPEQFRQTLFTGLGPAKGFGCGLLLVRRV